LRFFSFFRFLLLLLPPSSRSRCCVHVAARVCVRERENDLSIDAHIPSINALYRHTYPPASSADINPPIDRLRRHLTHHTPTRAHIYLALAVLLGARSLVASAATAQARILATVLPLRLIVAAALPLVLLVLFVVAAAPHVDR
jgi:hypothetical protein